MKKAFILIGFLFIVGSTFSQAIPVNIFPTPAVPTNYPKNESHNYFDFNGVLIFTASDFNFGWELWKTNGDLNGTSKIISFPGALTLEFITIDNKFYFTALDPATGYELYVSDGTTAGTVLFKDINPGSASSGPSGFVAKGDTLFFAADNGINGVELWMSDGTAAGTQMVKDIHTTPLSANGISSSDGWLVIGNILYFDANNFTNGLELWRSDGSAAGTYMVKDINPGSGSSGFYNDPMLKVGNNFYFKANDGVSGLELFRSDGTTLGTYLVKDIYPGITSSMFAGTSFLNTIGDSLIYFRASDGLYGHEFWRSNGTLSGTYILNDFNVGSGNGDFGPLTEYNGDYYIAANLTNTVGVELYKTNAFLSSFTLVKDINLGASGSFYNYQGINFTLYNNKFYFEANNGVVGSELWASDGTTSGTSLVKDIRAGSSSSTPKYFKKSGNKLYFDAMLPNDPNPLWKLDTCQAMLIAGTTDSVTGSITTTVTGGTLPYFGYLWSNGATTQSVTGLTQGNYTVIVYDNKGCAETANFTLNSTIGIKEVVKDESIIFYPNPTSGKFCLQNFKTDKGELEIFNILGEKVFHSIILNNKLDIELSDQKNGVYFLHFKTGETSYSRKLILVK